MRLPFPSRIPLPAAFVGATILAGLQQLQKTSIAFTIYSFLFLVIATLAFNMAGGFTRPSGSYVFFYSMFGLIIGIVYKAFLGEPGDSNLRMPVLTMQVFTGSITAMLIAVTVSRRISRTRPFLANVLKDKDMKNCAIGCFAFGVFLFLISLFTPHQDGSFLSALMQLNRFYQMSIIIGTLHVIKKTGGRTGFSFTVLLFIAFCTLSGAIFFSKEGMFLPALCWFVAAASMRLKLPLYQIAAGGVIIFVMFHFLVPYSQYGRDRLPGETFQDRLEGSFTMLTNLGTVRNLYLEEISDAPGDSGTSMDYYNEPQGFFDRLTMIGPDDALINYTNQGNFTGISVIPAYFANWIPHFLWPGKPNFGAGNYYAHKIGGIIAEDDFSTGISFSPSGEAYQLAGWVGVFVVAPIIWIMLFTIVDSLCGDTRKSPWGLLVIALFSHAAPEGMLGGAIYIMWFGSVGIIFVALTSTYIMPLIGTLFVGPEKTGIIRLRRNPALVPVVPRQRPSRFPSDPAATRS